MIDQPPPIPTAVVQFAKDNKIENIKKDDIFYMKKELFHYKNADEAYYGVSENIPIFKEKEDYIYTHCTYILVEGNNVRLATPEETEELNRILCL